MDLRRLRPGEWIAALSGAALVVSLFLPWYRFTPEPGVAPAGPAGDGSTGYGSLTYDDSAWEAFAVVDVLLLLAALAGVALLVVTATQGTPAVPIALAALTTLVAIVALLLVLLKVLFEPDPEAAGIDVTRLGGLWLALAATAGMAAGSAIAMRDERLSMPGRPTDTTGRPVPATEVEAIPAPRP